MSTPAEQIALLEADQAKNNSLIDQLTQQIASNEALVTQINSQIEDATAKIDVLQQENGIYDDIISSINGN